MLLGEVRRPECLLKLPAITTFRGTMPSMNDLNGLGFALADLRLSEQQCDYISASLPAPDARGGVRGLLSHPTLLTLLRHKQLGQCLWSFTGRDLVAVGARVVNVSGGARGSGQWRQDRVLAVRERMDVHGYGPWTTHLGVPHVEPPSSVLKQMIVLRVNIDGDTPEFAVLPGSHRGGKLDHDQIGRVANTIPELALPLMKGSLLLMNPLIVHTMRSGAGARSCRVLHIEFAPVEAISPLQWSSAVQVHRAA